MQPDRPRVCEELELRISQLSSPLNNMNLRNACPGYLVFDFQSSFSALARQQRLSSLQTRSLAGIRPVVRLKK